MLTPEKYERLKVLVTSSSDISEETLAKADAAMREYEAQPQNDPGVQGLMQRLDPSMPIAPQVLATTPGTTHPEGDEGAESEWLRGPIDNPAGRVVVYEAPAAKVRERLMQSPELGNLVAGRPLSAEEIAAIQPGDSIYESFNDLEWKKHSDAAAASGKTAYRYAKAPYLQGGENAGWLDTLSTKLGAMPLDGLAAAVMGYDDAANFGSIGSNANDDPYKELNAQLAADRERKGIQAPAPVTEGGRLANNSVDEAVGGPTVSAGGDAQARRDMLEEENPVMSTLGGIAGALDPRGLSSKLFSATLGGVAKSIAPAGAGLARRALGSAAGIGAAGAVDQEVREGVNAASNYVETGDTGTTLDAAAGRVGTAAIDSLKWGLPFAGLQGAAKIGGKWVREGQRYKGLPGQAEKLNGGKVEVGKGHIEPPEVQSARAEGRARKVEVGPVDVIAERLDEPIRKAGSKVVAEAEQAGRANEAAHYPTREGKVELQQKNTVRAALDRMRTLTSDVAGDRKAPVGRAGADHPLHGIFNAAIENVTTKPSKSGVPLSMKEAKAYLSPEWQKKAKLPALEEKGVKRVYVTPRRLDSKHADEAVRQLAGSADEDVKAVYEAALADREGRAWNGLKGGWSKVQEHQAKGEAKAKEMQELAGGDKPGGAYKAVVRSATPHKGESRSQAAIAELAKRADIAAAEGKGAAPGQGGVVFQDAKDSLARHGIHPDGPKPPVPLARKRALAQLKKDEARVAEASEQAGLKKGRTLPEDHPLYSLQESVFDRRLARENPGLADKGEYGDDLKVFGYSPQERAHYARTDAYYDSKPAAAGGGGGRASAGGPRQAGPGATEKLFNSARAAGVMDELRGWSSLGKNPSGHERGRVMQAFDAATLRLGYPLARKLEKAGNAGSVGRLGHADSGGEDREKRKAARTDEHRGEYEAKAASAEKATKKKRKRPSWQWMREENQ